MASPTSSQVRHADDLEAQREQRADDAGDQHAPAEEHAHRVGHTAADPSRPLALGLRHELPEPHDDPRIVPRQEEEVERHQEREHRDRCRCADHAGDELHRGARAGPHDVEHALGIGLQLLQLRRPRRREVDLLQHVEALRDLLGVARQRRDEVTDLVHQQRAEPEHRLPDEDPGDQDQPRDRRRPRHPGLALEPADQRIEQEREEQRDQQRREHRSLPQHEPQHGEAREHPQQVADRTDLPQVWAPRALV